MKKTISKKLSKRLLQYGALSAAALGAADASGQIVYTDLDPDHVLNVGDEMDYDFNSDGLTNLNVSNPDGLAGGNAAIVFPSSGGAFVGFTAGGYDYPLLLAEGDIIDSAAGYTTPGDRGDLNYYGCAYSNSQWCNTVVDGYLGLRFDDIINGTTHYGWVRMDTDVGGTNIMTVKDFAYNSTPNEGIAAGDTGSLGIEDNSFEGFSHFVDANSNLYMKAMTALDMVAIHNVVGQEVLSQKLSNNVETVSLSNLSSGMYIATVTIEGQSKSFKIIKK